MGRSVGWSVPLSLRCFIPLSIHAFIVPTYQPTSQPANQPTSPPAHLPACLPACVPACLPRILGQSAVYQSKYHTKKNTNYLRTQRDCSKRLIHLFQFDLISVILHVLNVKTFLLHSAAKFLCGRKSSILTISAKFDSEFRYSK